MFDLLEYWRFFLPFFAGLAMGAWIYRRFANHLVGVLVAAPVLGVLREKHAD